MDVYILRAPEVKFVFRIQIIECKPKFHECCLLHIILPVSGWGIKSYPNLTRICNTFGLENNSQMVIKLRCLFVNKTL